MGEVAKWFHVNQSLLHTRENRFDILKPAKHERATGCSGPEH